MPVKVAKVECVADVYAEILKVENKGTVYIIRYEDLTEKKKSEINEMMKNSILRNNRLHVTTAKSLFFQGELPC